MGNKLFKNTKPDNYFRLMDGSEIKNVQQLAQSIQGMSEDVFYSHLNEEKNDFSSWIKDVFEDHELAEKVENCRDQNQTELTLLRHLLHRKRK
mgnify:CR=1 FL=1